MEAFSGLHNFQKRVIVIYDECSMIAEPIWRATDGMLNDAETQAIKVKILDVLQRVEHFAAIC